MRDAYIDACVLLNLFASQQMERILSDLGSSSYKFYVMPWVVDNEILHVYERQGLSKGDRKNAELKPFISSGLLTLAEGLLDEQEQITLINLAAKLDQGEAETLTAAIHRGGVVVTDDGKTRKLIKADYPDVVNTTTVGLMKIWATSVGLNSPTEELAQILLNIEISANFIPGMKDPDQLWWKSITESLNGSNP